MKEVRPIAIYLPQFHPIPENDAAWGEGFTEWTNVKKAKPLFKGHYQPHIPHEDVGYYDLRDSEVLIKQAAMAKEYGIYGFAFYHYWFNGKRLLNLPLDNMLKTGKPHFPFCYIWANENWTRRWDGRDNDVIISQNYSFEDDVNHIRFLCENVFSDSRYIRVNGRPFFIVYRTNKLPEPQKTTDIWREVALKEGIGEIYLCRMEIGYFPANPYELGFDAAIHFHPDTYNIERLQPNVFQRILHRLGMLKLDLYKNIVYDYISYAKKMSDCTKVTYKRYPGIMPSWDNSARVKSNAIIFKNASPAVYEKWLYSIKQNFIPFSSEENFIFINAWNEWAEGAHLEPDRKFGYAYLQATAEAIIDSKSYKEIKWQPFIK